MTWTATLPSARALGYTAPSVSVKHTGLGRPESDKAQQPRPPWTAAFFMPVGCTRHAQLSFLAGCVGTPARVCRYLIPVDQPNTACHPCLVAGAAGSQPVDKEPFMANTHTPQGRTTPTPATHPQQLFADAVNAASMATWYTRRGNIAAAARKARQHLAALNQLAKLEGGAA